MTLFIEGFDWPDTPADLGENAYVGSLFKTIPDRWLDGNFLAVGRSVGSSIVAGRGNGFALSLGDQYDFFSHFIRTFNAGGAFVVNVGMAVWIDQLPAFDMVFAYLTERVDAHTEYPVTLWIMQDGTVQTFRETQVEGPWNIAPTPIVPRTWNYVEFKSVIEVVALPTPRYHVVRVDLRVNGGAISVNSSILTTSIDPFPINFWLQLNREETGTVVLIDDLYIENAVVPFRGPLHIHTLIPDKDILADWPTIEPTTPTTHFDKVGEFLNMANDDANYIEADAAGLRDTYGLEGDRPSPNAATYAVGVSARGRQTAVGDRDAYALVASPNVLRANTRLMLPDNGDVYNKQSLFERDAQGDLWLPASLAGLRAGVESR